MPSRSLRTASSCARKPTGQDQYGFGRNRTPPHLGTDRFAGLCALISSLGLWSDRMRFSCCRPDKTWGDARWTCFDGGRLSEPEGLSRPRIPEAFSALFAGRKLEVD